MCGKSVRNIWTITYLFVIQGVGMMVEIAVRDPELLSFFISVRTVPAMALYTLVSSPNYFLVITLLQWESGFSFSLCLTHSQ